MCKAYVAAAAQIRPTALLLVAAINQQDLNPDAINRNPDDINRLGTQLREEIDSLVPNLLATYDKVSLEKDVGTLWTAIQGALREQRDVATPAFLRQLQATAGWTVFCPTAKFFEALAAVTSPPVFPFVRCCFALDLLEEELRLGLREPLRVPRPSF